ncbi:MAG: ABC transporter permease [Intestinimonas sp.]|jgi:D-methionine transport system permease protein|nr:ABC transporter permease [Intestinimonas sp.]
MPEIISAFWNEYGALLLQGIWDTAVMTGVSTLFAYVIGLPLGILLVITQPHGIWPHRRLNRALDWVVNIGRSLPFIILMISITGFTKLIMGTFIGVRGAIVPLVVSAAPFVARMVETSLTEVDTGVVEAAQSMGASVQQIVFKVYLPEAMPSLVLGGSISMITVLAYTAIAGAVGAGGLGDLAIRYGYQRKVKSMLVVTVVFLIVVVQVIQSIFNLITKKIDKRIRL